MTSRIQASESRCLREAHAGSMCNGQHLDLPLHRHVHSAISGPLKLPPSPPGSLSHCTGGVPSRLPKEATAMLGAAEESLLTFI